MSVIYVYRPTNGNQTKFFCYPRSSAFCRYSLEPLIAHLLLLRREWRRKVERPRAIQLGINFDRPKRWQGIRNRRTRQRADLGADSWWQDRRIVDTWGQGASAYSFLPIGNSAGRTVLRRCSSLSSSL